MVDQLGTCYVKLGNESWHILDGCRGDRLWSLEIAFIGNDLVLLRMIELLVSSKVARGLADANLD